MTSATETAELSCAAPPRDRRRYLSAAGVALWGAQVGQVALPLTAVTVLHAGASGTSLLKTALTLPFVVLGLPVGAWLDRVRRRPVMIGADLVRAGALLTVPAAAWSGHLTAAHLLAVVTVLGIATVFFDLGAQSHLKDLVPGARLADTNARLATITQSALIAGPPLAGWAAALLSAPAVLLATAGGYLWSAARIATLTAPEHPSGGGPRRRLGREMAEGVAFVARQPVLRTVLAAGCLVNVGTAGVTTLLPVLALTGLGWSEGQLGAFLGAGGVGGLVGAVSAVRLAGRLGAGRASLLVGVGVAPAAACLPLLCAPVPAPVAAAGWALVVLKVGFDSVVMLTFRQQVTPAGLLGRVNGTMRVLFAGAVALGAASAGVLAQVVGLRGALGVSAGCLACAWVPIALSPLRRMTVLGAGA
ncbi:MFS transporter [Kitasatospora sp. NPDC097691]|uniref:MFS transporter n=1 Tax=Kitasatospora sp. NPDC097691 TaxID=3157231 RepID=UPI00331FA3FF